MPIKIALVGNPNCGKTTMFNALTGANQYVGNWPGVTVEKKEGKLRRGDDVIVTDLPGIYSLSPYTPEEVVARNYLIGERPNVILNIVDGTNLERNLYLTTQLMEIGIPVVIAINMMDVLRRNGDKIDISALSLAIGCPIVEISALKGDGIWEAAELAIAAATGQKTPPYIFSGRVEHTIAHIEEAAVHHLPEERQRWYAIKILERDERVLAELGLDRAVLAHIEKDITATERELDDDAESIVTNERYLYIGRILAGCYKKKSLDRLTLSDKIDRVVTNRFAALPIFAAVMFLVYFISIGSIGQLTVDFMNETLFGTWIIPTATSLLEGWGCAPWLVSLIGDGILNGVGAVLGFVPQMLILFLLLSLLEDCGYMSRVAFIMDRIFRKLGLSGKSFIPMLVASGCGVPGIMASRTIEQERDRRMTVMTTGFIPCGAKMPVVAFIASAMFGGSALVAVAAYFVGIGAVAVSGIILKKTKLFAGDAAPFVMELPAYHAPLLSGVLRTTLDRGWSFVKRAGSVIFAASVILWALNSFSLEGGLHYITNEAEHSVLALIGGGIAWLFKPLGFGTWQAAVATLLGLVAKEEIVGAFGTLAGMEGIVLEDAMGTFFFGAGAVGRLSAFSFLIFNLLCAPCFAAMGAIRREMNSAKWTAFAIGYMCAFAYAISLIVYNVGMLMSGVFSFWTIPSFLVLGALIYLLVRRNTYSDAPPSVKAK